MFNHICLHVLLLEGGSLPFDDCKVLMDGHLEVLMDGPAVEGAAGAAGRGEGSAAALPLSRDGRVELKGLTFAGLQAWVLVRCILIPGGSKGSGPSSKASTSPWSNQSLPSALVASAKTHPSSLARLVHIFQPLPSTWTTGAAAPPSTWNMA